MKSLPFLLLAASATLLHAEVRLPRIIADGMVLQRGDSISLWGNADPGETVHVDMAGRQADAVADAAGQWNLRLAPVKAGGPYELNIGDKHLQNVYVGDVWLTSGQSNMDVHIDRVREIYADLVGSYANPQIHLIQLDRTCVADGPHSDIGPGSYKWEALTPEKVGHWSALSYFFAKERWEQTGIPQGIVNASLGGSDIVAFISRGKLEEVAPKYVQEMDRLRMNEVLEKHAMEPSFDDSGWEVVDPQTKRNDWRGTLWFRKTFTVPDSLVGREAVLRLGYWIDSDITYINGQQVGTTGYEYPPRIYKVKPGVLHAGENVLTVRLKTGGNPVISQKDKPYRLVFPKHPESAYFDVNDTAIPLDGEYRMCRGAMPNDAVNNSKGSVLYDGQIAPIERYRINGIIWNQGETNAGRPEEYAQLLPALAEDWRSHFGNVPMIIVQLANYQQRHTDANFYGGWAKLREAQRTTVENLPNAGLACAIEIGEWNDIHPLRKQDIAHRCVLQAMRLCDGWQNGRKVPGKMKQTVAPSGIFTAEGPSVERCEVKNGQVIVRFRKGTAVGLKALSVDHPVSWRQCDFVYVPADPLQLRGFAIAGTDGKFVWADAKIVGETVVLSAPSVDTPTAIRYGWDDNPEVSLFNANNLPCVPFEVRW